MFDINKKPDKTAWITFPEDQEEQYLVKFITEDVRKDIEKMEDVEALDKILSYVLDWKGIIANDKPLECTSDNKILALGQQDPWSRERFDFLVMKMMTPNIFYNIGKLLKNSKQQSK